MVSSILSHQRSGYIFNTAPHRIKTAFENHPGIQELCQFACIILQVVANQAGCEGFFFRFESEANTVPELTGACQAQENDQSELCFCLRVTEANNVIGGCRYQTRAIQ